jgi:thiamine kinase-like enzyme
MNSLLFNEEKLHLYLEAKIFPRLASPPYGRIKVKRISDQKPIYLIHERKRKIKVVGKFYASEALPLEEAWRWAEKSYFNLKQVRGKFGMNNGIYRVVAPLGKKKDLSALLVTEMAPGETLDYYIANAIYEKQPKRLFDRLSCLAWFFVKLHHNSETDRQVSPDPAQWYLDKLLHSLSKGPLTSSQRDTIEKYAARWWEQRDIFTDREVLVHGDATPTNFFFYHHEVIGIDLDQMKLADRCWDLGFMAAELKHHFMWRMGDGWAAEPFIGHFLWTYAIKYKDEQFFYMITRKLPLYMSLGLLRIARNTWLDEPHRRNLVQEAKRCLKYGL